ncbi:sensor histidine kinase [Roseomonas hellenica]|nr:sensor histidine kinase [Plastoroseomonas hellenica]MBR0642907.1 sensor histidine kinase [Plastoroseomonas hellenica]
MNMPLRRHRPAYTPGMLEDRLRSICEDMRILCTDADQAIGIEISISGACPDALADTVLHAAQIFIGNALDHGLHGRPAGRIEIRVSTVYDQTALVVADDGWGLPGTLREGPSLALVRQLAARHHGHLRLLRTSRTEAVLNLHHGRLR